MNRRVALACGVGAAAAAAGGALAWWRMGRGDGTIDPALWKMRFEQPSGGMLAMASLRGAPLLLNFWATWCAPCIKEMPLLDAFYREHRASGWQVVGLAIDALEPVRAYLARLPIGFPIALAGMQGAELSRRLGNDRAALPFTLVLRRDGSVLARKLGPVSTAELQTWRKSA